VPSAHFYIVVSAFCFLGKSLPFDCHHDYTAMLKRLQMLDTSFVLSAWLSAGTYCAAGHGKRRLVAYVLTISAFCLHNTNGQKSKVQQSSMCTRSAKYQTITFITNGSN
jgi:hypothetical protein